MKAADFFAQTYAQARSKFMASAHAAGLVVQSHAHPLPGHDGEALAMDVARCGADDAQAVLLITSACHGVEGFCGSGVQNALLAQSGWLADAQHAGIAVVFVHALNPFGFSYWRRTTHENVDLNRNWQDFSQPLPHNAGYDAISHLVLPPAWPPSAQVQAELAAYATQHGARALQTAISGGQYRHADGLFFGGHGPTWSQQTLRQVLRQHATRCRRLSWIDLHTGLGANGDCERIHAGRDDAAALARARAWWGPRITSMYDGSSLSAPLTGLMWLAAYQECPRAEYTGMAMEYGTLPLDEMIEALRCGQWHQNHPQAPAADRAAARQRVRDAFYTDTDGWKQRIVDEALDAARQTVRGLAA